MCRLVGLLPLLTEHVVPRVDADRRPEPRNNAALLEDARRQRGRRGQKYLSRGESEEQHSSESEQGNDAPISPLESVS